MDGVDVLDGAKVEFAPPAEVHGVDIFQPLLLEPGDDLEVGNDERAGAFRDRHTVIDMVPVTVRDEDEIRCDSGAVDLPGQFIPFDEGIKEKRLSAHDDAEAGVSVVSDLHEAGIGFASVGARRGFVTTLLQCRCGTAATRISVN